MKKIVVLLFIVMGLIFACSERINFSKEGVPVSFEHKIEKFDIIKYNNSIRLKGDIKGWVSSNGDLNIYTETEDSKHIFFVQHVKNLNKNEFDINELIYLNDGLYFVEGGNKFFLGAMDNANSNLARDDVKSVFGQEVKYFYGNGVGYSKVSKSGELSNVIDLSKLKEGSSAINVLNGMELKAE